MSHILLKTQDPETIDNAKIVSRPSGDNPWYLVSVPELPEGMEADVVEDSVTFLSQFDLMAGEEVEGMV